MGQTGENPKDQFADSRFPSPWTQLRNPLRLRCLWATGRFAAPARPSERGSARGPRRRPPFPRGSRFFQRQTKLGGGNQCEERCHEQNSSGSARPPPPLRVGIWRMYKRFTLNPVPQKVKRSKTALVVGKTGSPFQGTVQMCFWILDRRSKDINENRIRGTATGKLQKAPPTKTLSTSPPKKKTKQKQNCGATPG